MFGPTKFYFIVFGFLTIGGGVMGYLKAGSSVSLMAGSLSGVFLLFAAFLFPTHPLVGVLLGGILCLLLIGYFLPGFFRSGEMMPTGVMSVLSFIGIAFAIAAWIRK